MHQDFYYTQKVIKMAWEYTIEATQEIATMFQVMLKEALLKKIYPYGNPQSGTGDKYASGDLYNSIQTFVEIDPNGQPTILLEYLDYYDWVNKGRLAGVKRVPTSALMDWIKIRGIKTNEEFGTNGIAYAINKSRKNKGKKPLPLNILREWIKKKGLKMSEEKKTLSLAFAIQQNIFKFGIRKTNIYDVGLDSVVDIVDNPPPDLNYELERLYQAMAEDINILLDNMLTKTISTQTT